MATHTEQPVAAGSRLAPVGLGVVRIGVALMWIQNAAWKRPPDFDALRHFTELAVKHPVFPPWSWLVENLVLPNFAFFGWVTLLVEAGLGAFLLVGLATRLWAAVGIGQSAVIALSVLNAPNEWHWSYYLMILAHIALLAGAAGRGLGVDGVLRPAWLRSDGRLSGVLVRLS